MKRTSRAKDRRHRSRSRRGSNHGVTAESSRRIPDKVQSVQRAAGNQAVQAQDSEGKQKNAKKGTWWGGRGYEEPTKEERERGVPESEVEAAVVEWLRTEGITPPSGDVNLADYLTTDMTISSEDDYPFTSARIRVGPNGNLLPSMEAIQEQRPEGGYEAGSLQTASTWIEFEFHRIPDGGLYIQTSEQTTKERPTGTVIAMTKAADVDMSIRDQTPGYDLTEDERIPRTLSDLVRSADIEPREAASKKVPGGGGTPEGKGTSEEVGGPSGEGEPGGPAGGKSPRESTREPPGPADSDLESPKKPKTGTPVPAASEGSMDEYRVRKGDTLWDIAERVYGDGRKWPVIFEANKKTEENPEGIEDPDLIHKDQELMLPPREAAERFDRSTYDAPGDYGIGSGTF